jgi:hypothetical protein
MLNIKKVKLTANYVLTTKNTYSGEPDGGVIIPKGTLKEYQRVIEIGPMVRTVQVGDLVSINPKRYAVTKYRENDIKGDIEHMQKIVSYNIPEIEINHEKHLLITDQDIEFVITEYEEEKPNNIIIPKQEIILPK